MTGVSQRLDRSYYGARLGSCSGPQHGAATNGHSGVEAAETGESDALERGRECCARDGTVGVAHVVYPPYRVWWEESTQGRHESTVTDGYHRAIIILPGRPEAERNQALGGRAGVSLRSVPCCDFSSRLLSVIIHARHGFSAGMMPQRRSAKTNPSLLTISPVWIGTGWRNMGPA